MSAPVLTKNEQNKSLSGIKNRKKVEKKILAAPEIVRISKPVVDEAESSKIIDTLIALLPSARLPMVKESDTPVSKASLKRKQLLLGINAISRGIKNGSIASVIFADDIKPKLLINHLITLCTLKNIPYMYLENFRMITRQTLGFSCIALGFKKDVTFFSPVHTLIESATQTQTDNSTIETADNVEMGVVKDIVEESKTEKVQKTFTYLYRDSNKKRMFPPDSNQKKFNSTGFISLPDNDDEETRLPMKFGMNIPQGRPFQSGRGRGGGSGKGKNRNKRARKEVDYYPVLCSETRIIKTAGNPHRK